MAPKDKPNKNELKAPSASEKLHPGDAADKNSKSKKGLNNDATFVVVPSSYHSIVLEALSKAEDKTGMSIMGLKKYMTENYPDKEWPRCKNYVRKALEKGLSSGEIVRPKKSEEAVGLTGRFKLNKNLDLKQTSKVKPGGNAKGTKASTTGKRKSSELLGYKVKKGISEKKKVKGGKETQKTKVQGMKEKAKGEKKQTKVKAASKGEGSSSKTKDKKENIPPQVKDKKKSSKPNSREVSA
ncbi:sperm-specific protein PHI-2B-like isoform X2 [Palaemon carinicauda]